MAASYISSVHKTADGTITVPANCTAVYALQKGSTTLPVIAGVDMSAIAVVEATPVIPAVGIFEYRTPAIAELAFTFTGDYVEFVFVSGSDGFRPGAVFGYNSGGVLTGEQPTSTTDLVLGILIGSIGPTTLKGDTVAMTYLVNTTLDKAGYITPGDSSLTCEAKDTGTTTGYTITPPVIHHAAVLLQAAYWDYPAVWHPGAYRPTGHYVPGAWVDMNGHMVWVAGHYVWTQEWDPGYFTYSGVFHEAVWQDAYDEQPPDIVVPAGTSQLSAVFISIKTTPSGGFVSRPHVYQ